MRRTVFITMEDAQHGFELSGSLQRVLRNPDMLIGELLSLQAEPDIGLVAVDERLASGVSWQELKDVEAAASWMIVVLPPPGAARKETEQYELDLIKRTVGYHMRIK